jgi:hypothetical protein
VKIVKHIHLGFADVQLLSIGIIRIEMIGKNIIGREESLKINIAQGELLNNEKHSGLVIMVADSSTQFTKEAREFSASEEGLRFSKAEALIVKNLAQNLIVSFYLKINQPSTPSKAFKTEEEAIEWLLSLK